MVIATIMVPVDLDHLGDLRKTLEQATDTAREHGATLVFVGVTAAQPGAGEPTLEAYGDSLREFAAQHAIETGVPSQAFPVASPDPENGLDEALLGALRELGGIDLVMMASHLPRWEDGIWSSTAARVAAQAPCSVMLVRD